MQWYEKYAEKIGVKVNPDTDTVKIVLEGLDHNTQVFGKRYCPCRLDHTPDTICPCKEMRENKECHCMLFT